jgi:glycosyltransferase involved in cell wall biosynthesis
VPDSVELHHIDSRAPGAASISLTDWQPDVVFLHGLSSPTLEATLTTSAPLVRFLHTYTGSCISGTKTQMSPTPAPCARSFGPGCLLQYFPRHCGGWHPLTMVSSYRRQRRWQDLLTRATFVATLSEHMRQESITHGVDPVRAVRLPPFVPSTRVETTGAPSISARDDAPWHLLFAGRMEPLKGAHLLLDALATLDIRPRRRVRVTFSGDGGDRQALARRAATLGRSDVDVHFVGWLSPDQYARLLGTVDLLVVPSVWPEPFGFVGLEAASAGVPAVAFDVGGIREWLTDEVSGRLVRAVPPSSESLAEALADCLSDPVRLHAWGVAALEKSRLRTLGAHVQALETLFLRAADARLVA